MLSKDEDDAHEQRDCKLWSEPVYRRTITITTHTSGIACCETPGRVAAMKTAPSFRVHGKAACEALSLILETVALAIWPG